MEAPDLGPKGCWILLLIMALLGALMAVVAFCLSAWWLIHHITIK
jgi:hypothetical protein